MMVLWSIGLLMFCIILLITYKQRFSRIGRMAAKLPGPRLVFLVGNSFEFGTNPVEFFNGLLKTAADYGVVARIWLGPSLYIVISDLRDIEFFLSSRSILNKSDNYKYIREGWLGNGVGTVEGAKWWARRKMLAPAFHLQILEKFVDVFSKNSNILIKRLEGEIGKADFAIEPYVSDCALDILCESVMGTAVNAQLDLQSEFTHAIKSVTTAAVNRAIKPWLYPEFIFNISSTGRSYNHGVKYIMDFVDQVIQKKKKVHEERKLIEEGSGKHTDQNGCHKKYAFLDLMLQYRDTESETLSDIEVREEVNTFMFAGQDTVTSAISFTLYAVARHPEIQEEAVKELQEIFGNSDREETFQDLQNMKYLERVIKESMRIYTTGPIIGRNLTQDVTIPSGYTLPKGASVLLFLYKLHHNPEIYPNPEEFNPDNFLPERVQSRSLFAYCPFSAGPRNCIGHKFAMLEMKSVLSNVLRKYKLYESGPQLVLSSEFVLRSATGMHVRIEKRT